MDSWTQSGRHRYQHRDDVLLYEQRGVHNHEEMDELLALLTKQGERYGYIIILANAKEAAHDPPELRRAITNWRRANICPMLAVVYNTTMVIRVAAMLLVRASQLLNKVFTGLRFVATQDEAWAVVEKEREVLRRASKSTAD